MLPIGAYIKTWFPAVASVSAVLLTATYAVTRQSRAAEGIRTTSDLASTLSDVASQVEQTVISPEKLSELAALRKDLEARMQDARKPGLVVPEVNESARRAGLEVREIQPLVRGEGQVSPDQVRFPRYRISVSGDYSRIAEFMELCETQRLPARVVEFRVFPEVLEDGSRTGLLIADTVIEAFRPEDAAKPMPTNEEEA